MNDIAGITVTPQDSGADSLARTQLLEALREVVRADGTDAVSVEAIVQAASLSPPDFCKHFASISELATELVNQTASRFKASLDRVRDQQTDAAHRLAMTVRYGMIAGVEDRQIGRLTNMPADDLLLPDIQLLSDDLALGISRGRFRIDDATLTADLILGMMTRIVEAVADSRMPATAIDDTARSILRMIGIPDVVARAIVQTRLPPLPAPKRQCNVSTAHVSADNEPGTSRNLTRPGRSPFVIPSIAMLPSASGDC